ncbi:hypothetical protein [Caenibius sp. WL]|uniref:hypothetical protein n=1 Tax=Caenibius sp. WL TaxID=2872646 RepID=UPI001C9A0D4A|nr:hypothetical protein [Caenibius sp. WL]QZP08753.1 hypothetical protein K5X80_02865 [Caenibius sp. WL]
MGSPVSDSPASPGALKARVAASLDAPMAPLVRAYATKLAEAAGAQAVLFYGSNLRTGELEGVLDFYVLLPGPRESGIWPRVSYHEWEHDGQVLRAKVATMHLATFHAAASGDLLDTTIWARFVQPCALAWVRDEAARAGVIDAIAAAIVTATRLAVALGPQTGVAEDFWRALFRATYKAEFRVEKPGREDTILAANRAHFDGLLSVALEAANIPCTRVGAQLAPLMKGGERNRIRRWWSRRRRLGKPYNLARLVRATATFDGAARYAAWKVERHTGVAVAVTPWREKHPLLAAPGVLWRVWRERRKQQA